MKAAVHTSYGPPNVVRIAEVEKPTAKDNQVLVKVHATTVNRTDSGLRAAKPFVNRFFTGFTRPRVTVLGNEFAGEVEAVGSGVTSFQVGDRVFGYNGTRFGAHAEYLAMPEDGSLATMPANLTFEEAAPSTEGSHYALSLIRKAKIRSGKGLGADRVIDYTAEDFTKYTQSYDVVLDAVGKSSFGRCKRLLKPRGIYLSSDLGPLSQNPILALITPLLRGRKVLFPIPRDNQEMARYFKELLESGAFRPLIDRRYRLEEIVEAYRYVETGQKIGNVVISVEPSTS
jgi:NADPH:quinone reductase-like Zn-dependent oxidoreductase